MTHSPGNRILLRLDVVALAFLAALLIFKLTVVLGFFLPSGRQEWWGIHQFSDFLSLLGGRRFAQDGFFQNYFLMNTTVGPIELARGWQYYQVPQLVHNSAIYYTHYGSLDAIIIGLFHLAGIRSLTALYVIFSCVSFFGLAMWGAAVRTLFGPLVALVSVLVIAPSVFFFTVAESPTAESLSLTLTFVALSSLIFADHLEVSWRARVWLRSLFWFAAFCQANNNPQFVPLIAIFVTGYALLFWQRTRKSLVLYVVLVSSLPIGMGVHFVLAAWALGGWDQFARDMAAALYRRTIGFAEGVEIVFREFDVAKAPAYLIKLMDSMQGLSWWRAALMIVLPGLLILLGKPSEPKQQLRDWMVALLLLFGGLVFIAVFVEAAVTQPLDVLKVIMPGIGVLLGLGLRDSLRALTERRASIVSAMGALLAAVTVLPVLYFNLSGRSLLDSVGWSAFEGATIRYVGSSPEEVHRVAQFLSRETRFGDIVFAGFFTGDTSHPEYPNPAWEYLSNRQIRVFDAVENWTMLVADLKKRIDALPDGSIAKQTRFFALVANAHIKAPMLATYLTSYGVAVAQLEPDGTKRADGYTLYRIDSARTPELPIPRSQPSSETPWTSVLNVRSKLVGVAPVRFDGGWEFQEASFPGLLHKERKGFLHVYSGPRQRMNLVNETPQIRYDVGATLELRFLVDRQIRPDGSDDAVIAIGDGEFKLRVTFSGDLMTIRDQGTRIADVPLPALSTFMTLRLVLIGGKGFAYVDEHEVFRDVPLTRSVCADNAIAVGDGTPEVTDDRAGRVVAKGVNFDIDYLAFSNAGGFVPAGHKLEPPRERTDNLPAWVDTGRNRQASQNWIARGARCHHGSLVLKSVGTNGPAHFERTVPEFNNSRGSTFEVRSRISGGALGDRVGAMMLLRDGHRELSISFFSDGIKAFDSGREIKTIAPAPTSDRATAYRLAIVGECGYVFVDNTVAFAGELTRKATRKSVQFGDFTATGQRNLDSVVDQRFISTTGAFDPQGQPLARSQCKGIP